MIRGRGGRDLFEMESALLEGYVICVAKAVEVPFVANLSGFKTFW